MSFKLFLASSFGLIKPTAKIEAVNAALLADFHSFCEFEESAELKEFNELELLIKSATFLQRKRELQHLMLKGSKEEAQLSEFKKLGRDGRLKRFYSTEKSDDLKRFSKVSDSENLTNYKKLKSIVQGSSFDAGKKKDEKSEEFKKLAEYHKLKVLDDVVFYERFEKSKEYKNYLLLKESPERKRFEELQKITNSDEFKDRVAYLEDKLKWNKTEDAIKETRLVELKKDPKLINYLKYKNSNAFDFFRKWEMVFEDRFETVKLDEQKWLTQTLGANRTLGHNFSQTGDLQAFTEGQNISIEGKSLKIDVRKENAKGMIWQIPFGFVEHDFDYTSGVVSTAESGWWKHGILEAKIKYSPSQNIVDAFYLLGEENTPQINLVEMGIKNRVGMLSKVTDGIQANCESISGLKSGEFYIFRLEWTSHSLVWKINDREILTLNHNVPAFKMHLNAASVVVAEPTGSLPHRFEIEWVRFYQHKKA